METTGSERDINTTLLQAIESDLGIAAAEISALPLRDKVQRRGGTSRSYRKGVTTKIKRSLRNKDKFFIE